MGDNEVRDRVFLFEASGSPPRPSVASRRALGIPEISDVEAMARTSAGELLVYGSHSRNKRCRVRENRRVFTGLRLTRAGSTPGSVPPVHTPHLDWSSVFGDQPQGDLARVAAAVAAGEAAADRGDCRQRLDIEAAVAVPRPSGDEVWLGLRTPVVDGRAVLLRHDVEAHALRFVEARLLDLGGVGVRGLDHDGGRVFGTSPVGPGEGASFRLWSFPVEKLRGDAPIAVRSLASLPPHSEGVSVRGGHALVVQDGKEGSPDCEEESRYTVIRLP